MNAPALVVSMAKEGALLFEVQVSPRAKRTALMGVHDGALKVALQAPPVDGAANEALVAWLATWLDVPRKTLAIVAGQTQKRKRVAVWGMSFDVLEGKLKACSFAIALKTA